MIWIAGGTHETRELLDLLGTYEDILITVATDEGREFLPEGTEVLVGPVLRETIPDFVKAHDINLIVDLTHPFATRISESLAMMSERLSIPLLRFVRAGRKVEDERIIYAKSYEDAFEIIKNLKGNFLFTTGSKRADEFFAVRGENRFVFRILPTVASVKALTEIGVKINDIIAMVGPFTYDMNMAMLGMIKADYLVTKDSGDGSGIDEKIQAALDFGALPIVIKRNIEDGYSLEEVAKKMEDHRARKDTKNN